MLVPVCPALVVMPDDAQAGRGPAVTVSWRMDELFVSGMLDAFAQPIDDLRAGFQYGGQVVIGGGKIVVRWICGIIPEIAEEGADVHG